MEMFSKWKKKKQGKKMKKIGQKTKIKKRVK